mgnify:CR=1 FL=1
MLAKTKTINANGNSKVVADGKEITAMTMSATVNEDGSMNINKYIQNKDVYSDAEEFERFANGLMEV